MSEEPATIQEPKRRIGSWIARGVLVCLVWIVFAFLASSPAKGEIPIRFLAGWAFHARKYLPPFFEQWPSLILPLVCLAIAAFLAHRFIRWWLREKGKSFAWKPFQTISLISLILLGAGAAIAMSGIAHQSAWLSSEKWFEDRSKKGTVINATIAAKQVCLGLFSYQSNHGHFPDTFKELQNEYDLPSRMFWVESGPGELPEPFLLLKPGAKLSLEDNEALIVSPVLSKKGLIVVGFEDGSVQRFDASELGRFLHTAESHRTRASSSNE
jgi:hypothetical protein